VEYDASGNRVRFEFSTGQGGTPIVFDLERD
jgi:hypothetical protein